MKYRRPQIFPIGGPVGIIQSHTMKDDTEPFDGKRLTDPAYEADE